MASHRIQGDKKLEDLPEEIWCRYCNGIFEDPRLLPCLHSLCKKCLKDIEQAQEGAIACPVCLTDVECHLEELLPNVLARSKLKERENRELAKRAEPCGGCEAKHNMATSRCIECEEFLCYECIQAHKRVKFTKDHTILSLQELSERENPSKRKQTDEICCHIHESNPLNRFCVECDLAVCSSCIKESHTSVKSHTIINTKDAFDTAKVELRETLSSTRKKIPVLQKSVYEIIKRYGRVQTKAEEITWKIRQTSRHLIQAVKEREHQLLRELCALRERRSNGLVKEKETMERKLVRTIDGCDFTDSVLKEGKEGEVLLVKKVCTERLEMLQCEDTECQLDKVKLTFEPEEEPIFRAIKQGFGRILVLNAPPATGSEVTTGIDEPDRPVASGTEGDIRGSTQSLDDVAEPRRLGESAKHVSFSEPILHLMDEDLKSSTAAKPEKSRSRRLSLPMFMGKKPAQPVGKATRTKFTLTTADHKGQRKDVQIQLESPDGSVISAHVLDNKDGTYTVFYCPRTPGEHNVYVSISGSDIKHGQRLLNIYGSSRGMRGDELALACKVLCLLRWQITPGLIQMKNNKPVANPKIRFDDIGGPPLEVATAASSQLSLSSPQPGVSSA
ncbi:predicted protein [Nematostella vectensis]|uniref:Uncharacterized protein n=1 Tax=Nematostella vectensis TaxID=45351 RepID=A7S3Y2_NEMVE|nr:tripartite motif-containing protein 45 [Nematostella vectensis]EDO41566.1 predicted protein [Nematostella vectensis]|eukprot:XP_001633629.1 predicted protein [Nematostella vectensis]